MQSTLPQVFPEPFQVQRTALRLVHKMHNTWFQSSRNSGFSWGMKAQMYTNFSNKTWTTKRYWKIHCVCVCCFLTQVLFKCFFFFNLFIFGHAGSLLLRGLFYSCIFSLEQGPLSSFRARTSCGVVASLVVEPDSREAQQLWRVGLVALQHVESPQIRDRTQVSCIGRWILSHWATREALHCMLNQEGSFFQKPSGREEMKDNGKPWWIFSREVV